MTDIPSTRQFVACTFRPGDTRSYTYHFDHEPLVKGDRVVVSGKRGPSIVTVVDVGAHLEPAFETRPIVGKERVAVANAGTALGIQTLHGLEAIPEDLA